MDRAAVCSLDSDVDVDVDVDVDFDFDFDSDFRLRNRGSPLVDLTAGRTPDGSVWLWGEPANPLDGYWNPARDWEPGLFVRVLVVGTP